MQKIPEVITKDVAISRGVFEAEELEHLRLEIDQLWRAWPGQVSCPDEGLLLNATDTLPLESVLPVAGGALKRLVDICEIPEGTGVGLNTYMQGTKGPFHTHTESRATIVHPIGGGAYDIAPNTASPRMAEKTFMRLKVDAGDVVFSSGKILHRGVNLSNSPRRNLVFLHD